MLKKNYFLGWGGGRCPQKWDKNSLVPVFGGSPYFANLSLQSADRFCALFRGSIKCLKGGVMGRFSLLEHSHFLDTISKDQSQLEYFSMERIDVKYSVSQAAGLTCA